MQVITPVADKTIDLSTLRCPHLIIATIHALRMSRPGEIVQLIATDLNAPSSISAWARQSGHELLDWYDDDSKFVFFLRRGS